MPQSNTSKYLTEEKRKEIRDLFKKGYSIKEVANELNLTLNYFYKTLKKYHIPHIRINKTHTNSTKEILQGYIKQDLTVEDIAKKWNSSYSAVNHLANKYKLDILTNKQKKDREKCIVLKKMIDDNLSMDEIAIKMEGESNYITKKKITYFMNKHGLSRPYLFKRSPSLSNDQKELIKDLINKGLTAPKIAKQINTKSTIIRRFANKEKLPLKRHPVPYNKELIPEIIRLSKEGLLISEIAKKLNRDRKHLSGMIRDYKIPIQVNYIQKISQKPRILKCFFCKNLKNKKINKVHYQYVINKFLQLPKDQRILCKNCRNKAKQIN